MKPKSIVMKYRLIFNSYCGDRVFHAKVRTHSRFCSGVINLIMLCFLVVNCLFVSGNQAFAAECTEIFASTNNINANSDTNVGQSFTACQDGILSKIRLLSAGDFSGKTITIYEGAGLVSVLGSVSDITLHQAESNNFADFSVIDVSSANISVSNGSKYTFYFAGSSTVSLYYEGSDLYSRGTAYHQGNMLSAVDFLFEVYIVDGASITAPAVTNTNAASISTTSATLGGNVTADGGATVTERGVVYSTTDTTPTIGEAGVTKAANGSGTGSFTESIGSLSPGTTYYYNAYATNSVGTSYGDQVSFTTRSATTVTVVDGNWSSASTWSDGLVPTADQNVTIFNTVTLDTSPTVNNLTIDSGKSLACGSNAMTVNGASDINGTLTISTGSYTANGSFDASDGLVTFTAGGNLKLGGTVTSLGTFTKDTGMVTYDGGAQDVAAVNYYNLTFDGSGNKTLAGNIGIAGAFTVNGGSFVHNDKTVTYNGAAQTVAALNYSTLSFTGSTSGSTKTFANGTTKVDNQISITDSLTLTGSSRDDVTVQVTTPGAGGTASRVFSINASGITVNIEKMTIKGGDISGSDGPGGGIYVGDGTTVFLDTVTVSNSKAYRGGGIYYFTGTQLSVTGSTITGNTATYWAGGIAIFGTNATITTTEITSNTSGTYGGGIGINADTGEAEIKDCTFTSNTANTATGAGLRVAPNATATLEGTNTFSGNTTSGGDDNGLFNKGTINFTGASTLNITDAFTNTGTFNSGSSTVDYNKTAAQTIENVTYNNLKITGGNSSTKTLDTGTTNVGGELTIDSATTMAVGSNTLNATGTSNTSDINGTLTISIGTVDADGTFDAAGGAVTFIGAGNLKLGGAVTSLGTLSTDAGTVVYDGTGQTVLSDTYFNLNLTGTATATATGDININGNFTNTQPLIISGTDKTLSVTGVSSIGEDITTTGTQQFTGAVILTNNIALQADNDNVTFGNTVSGSGSARNLSVNAGSGTVSMGDHMATNMGTITKQGSGDFDTNGYDITSNGLTVAAGTFNTEGAGGTWDFNGNVTVSGGTLKATSGNLNFSGATWNTSGGTFTANNGTVLFDASGQVISGATSFYDLTKNATSADTLTFQSGTSNRTTITHTLDLRGADGNLLSLKSSSTGTQWEIDPQGSRIIAYLDVKDSKNVNNTEIDAAGTNSVNSGNNTGWSFAAPPTVTTNAASDVGLTGAILYGMVNANGFSTTVTFEYGPNTSYGKTVTADQSPVAGSTDTAVSKAISDLSSSTSYHYRVKGLNDGGTVYGSDQTFTTRATTTQTVADGAWSSGSTWSGELVPISSQSVTISNDVTLDTTAEINGLTISTGKTLTFINGKTLTVNGALDASAGTIAFSSTGTLNLAGTVGCSAFGTFNKGQSTVNYSGASQSVDDIAYYNLTLSGSGTKTLCGSIYVDGNLTNTATLNVANSGYAINIAGNWSNSGTFSHANGAVTFDGSGDSTLASGGSSFYKLTLNKSALGEKLSPSVDLTVGNALTITKGTFDLDTNDVNLSLGGALNISADGRWTKSSEAKTVTFTGAESTITDNSNPVQDLGHVKVD